LRQKGEILFLEDDPGARYDRQMRHLAALMLLAACTAHNPNFVGDGGGGDLLGSSCTEGERRCSATASEDCVKGSFATDRVCPAGSMCMQTYCSPPATMLPTQIGQRCDVGGAQHSQCTANRTLMLECQPFVNPLNLSVQWFCDKPVGTGGAGTKCTMGSECQSGFCGANGTCFRPCRATFECPAGEQCTDVQIVVEGVRVQSGSCVP
jgi:hypothetical protein